MYNMNYHPEEDERMKLQEIVPIFRMFDVAKAKEFYVDFLGFRIDWEHRFEPDYPLYMQISRGDIKLHLSEHHGDVCPGAAIRVQVEGIRELQEALLAQRYSYARPGLEQTPWGALECRVGDPFGNRITFFEQTE